MLIDRVVSEGRKCRWTWALLMVCCTTALAATQTPGVSDNQIKIGSCTVLDGPNRQYGIQIVLGATIYLHYINDHGGVFGRNLSLSSFDDGYDTERTGACFASLKRENVFSAGFFSARRPPPSISRCWKPSTCRWWAPTRERPLSMSQ